MTLFDIFRIRKILDSNLERTIKKIEEESHSIKSQIETIPSLTTQEMRLIIESMDSRGKKLTKLQEQTIQRIREKVGRAHSNLVSKLIVRLIHSRGETETKDLETEVERQGICSRATMFRKLKVLEERGIIKRVYRDSRTYYMINDESQIYSETENRTNETETSIDETKG